MELKVGIPFIKRAALLLGLALAPVSARATVETPLSEGFAVLNGVKLHYVEAGTGEKTILFLHGFPEFWYMWREQLKEFGQDFRAVAPDMRGYHLSEKPSEVTDYRIDKLVADVQAMLEHFSPGRKAVLVAHDWGAAIAWTFASQHPELLEKLVIINGPHPDVLMRELERSPTQRMASLYMKLFRTRAAEKLLTAGRFAAFRLGIFGASPAAFSAEDRAAYLDSWSIPGSLTGGLNYYRALQRPDSQAPAMHTTVPTLLIWGMKDAHLMLGNLEGLEAHASDFKIHRVPEGTHWIVEEQPELVNRQIRSFISR